VESAAGAAAAITIKRFGIKDRRPPCSTFACPYAALRAVHCSLPLFPSCRASPRLAGSGSSEGAEVLATGEADVVTAQATVKLGDSITAVISEAMVAAVEPAK
jgi:hypothetical protein